MKNRCYVWKTENWKYQPADGVCVHHVQVNSIPYVFSLKVLLLSTQLHVLMYICTLRIIR